MPIQLSCADYAFPKLKRSTAFAVIADLGFPAVDVAVFARNDEFTPAEVVNDPGAMAAELKGHLTARDLCAANVFAILGNDLATLAVNHPDADARAESRRWFRAVLAFTVGIGSPGLTLTPGIPWPGEPDHDARLRAADELQWRTELAAREGVGLSIEPHYQSITPTVDTTLQLLEQAPDLTLALDHPQFIFQGISEAEVDLLFPRTRHIHARQGAPGIMQATMGDGVVDYARIARAFAEREFDGYFCVEYVWDAWLDTNRVDCISESASLRDVILRALGRSVPAPGRRIGDAA